MEEERKERAKDALQFSSDFGEFEGDESGVSAVANPLAPARRGGGGKQEAEGGGKPGRNNAAPSAVESGAEKAGAAAAEKVWSAVIDEQGREYFWNTVTDEVTYEKPDGFYSWGGTD